MKSPLSKTCQLTYSASHRLPLAKNVDDSGMFAEWFHNYFIPGVKEYLVKLFFPLEALLLVENCSAHPEGKCSVQELMELFTALKVDTAVTQENVSVWLTVTRVYPPVHLCQMTPLPMTFHKWPMIYQVNYQVLQAQVVCLTMLKKPSLMAFNLRVLPTTTMQQMHSNLHQVVRVLWVPRCRFYF